MPSHTLLDTTPDPTGQQSPPTWSQDALGDVVVFLFAPFLALGYYATITFLKFLSREHSLNSPSC
jgi:hypothetical protein